MITTYVVLKFTHKKPVPDLPELAAGRAYTIDGVANCEVADIDIQALPLRDDMPAEAA